MTKLKIARYQPLLRVTEYCNLSLKITISVPDHSLPANCREWSGTSNLTIGTRVVTGIKEVARAPLPPGGSRPDC